MWLVWALGALLMCFQQASGTDPDVVTNHTAATLSCRFTNPASQIKRHYWTKNGKTIESTKKESVDPYMEYNIEKIESNSGIYTCVFNLDDDSEVKKTIEVKGPLRVGAHKHSENSNESDKAKLLCEAHSYPPPTDWFWYRVDSKSDIQPLDNSSGRFVIMSVPQNSTLTISDLQMEDGADYICNGTNSESGNHSDRITLRVRSRLAALWPFLGIVVEVIILITIIFIYEKRRKPDEINDDDDSGSAPLKSNSASNHKEKNVRQRNSN